MASMAPTFLASLRAVGTASTMAFAGFYLHRRGFVTPSGKKMMALLSQQVTIPAFLFAKIIYCPNGSGGGGGGRSMEELTVSQVICPSVADRISDLWMLLLWPFYVVLCGLFTGYVAAKLSHTPPLQTRSCLAACAFGNSTGLAITLLTVVHGQFGKSTELGSIDPTALLSVYLLLYPVLQWGVGGWLLAPEEKSDAEINEEKENIECVESGISMINQKEIGEDCVDFRQSVMISDVPLSEKKTNFGIIPDEVSPLPSYHNGTHHLTETQEPSYQQQDSHDENADSQHTQRPSLHISHLLNHESPQYYTPVIAAGQEEFGGVPPLRLFLSSSDATTSIGQGTRPHHQRWFTTGDIHASNSVLSMMRELSFTSFGYEVNGNNASVIANCNNAGNEEATPQSLPWMVRKIASNKGNSALFSCQDGENRYLLPHTGSEDNGPLMMDADVLTTAISAASMKTSLSSTNINVPAIHENVPLLTGIKDHTTITHDDAKKETTTALLLRVPSQRKTQIMQQSDVLPLTETLLRIARKVFQPPVIGALAGLLIASFPHVRGLLVNIWGDGGRIDGSGIGKVAPLQWMFDGIYAVGLFYKYEPFEYGGCSMMRLCLFAYNLDDLVLAMDSLMTEW